MNQDIQILVVDDHAIVRKGIGHILGREKGIRITGQAANGKEALLQLEVLSPNIVLSDIKMPGMDGIELTRQIAQKYPGCKTIMLTLYEDNEYIKEAFEAGAKGYLLKDTKAEEIVAAIRQVHEGETVISRNIKYKAKPD